MESGRYIDEESKTKKGFGKKKDGKADKKDKGYRVFEEEDSEEEVLVSKDNRTPMKLKKHSKPSFKFAKKPKEKEKEKEEKRKDEKEKKKIDKLKIKKKKFGNHGSMGSIPTAEPADFPVFGVALETSVQRNLTNDGIPLPSVFRECVDYIEEYGLACEGIYRISGVKSKVQALKELYNKQIPVYLKEYEPNVVASLLKQFLRELPEPILTSDLLPKFEQASTIKNVKQKVEEYQRLIEKLPECNRALLSWTIVHMTHVIAKEKQNKMSLQNVSIVLSPTMQISHRVLNVLFTYSKILFRETGIKKYVTPLKPVTSRWSLDLPDSPNGLEEELRKQETLLDELHKELMKVKDTTKEEQLWEVQRVVTGLKRKLKLMKKAQENSGRSPKLHKSLPPSSLDLKRKHKITVNQDKNPELDLTLRPDELSSAKNMDTSVLHKPETMGAENKRTEKISTPSKQITTDFGEIEEDSSAQSQRQHRRSDCQELSFDQTDNESKSANKDHQIETCTEADDLDNDKQEKVQEHPDEDLKSDQQSGDRCITPQHALQKPQTSGPHAADNDSKTVSSCDDERYHSSEVPETDTVFDKAKCTDNEDQKSDTDIEIDKIEAKIQDDEKEINDSKVESEVKCEAKTSVQREDTLDTEDHKEISKEKSLASMPFIKGQPGQTDNQLSDESETESTTDNNGLTIPETVPPDNTAGVPSAVGVTSESDVSTAMSTAMPGSGGVEPQRLASALSKLVQESEEELNQRIMSEFVQDFGIKTSESLEQDSEYLSLLQEHQALLLEEEELRAIGDELNQKIETEQNETERLREEIIEIQVMREDIYSSDYNSSSESGSENESDCADGDGADLEHTLNKLLSHNQSLEIKNKDLCDKIHQERQICIAVKVQIRMIQAKQLETSMNNQLDLLL